MTKAIQPHEERDVFAELDRQLGLLRSRVFETYGLSPFGAFVSIGTPEESGVFRTARADVSDTGASYKVVAEIPGIPKEKLDIRVRGALVEIRGETSKESEEKRGTFVQQERSYAGYYRALELPEPVVGAQAKATVENGVLELDLPKLNPSPSPDEVQIKVA